jgi:hypothetical protein
VFYSKTHPSRITWTFERFVQNQEKGWLKEAIAISNGFLSSVDYSASIIKNYVYSLARCLEGRSCWEAEYQKDKEIRRNRIKISELYDLGIFSDNDPLSKAFPPLGPIG